MAVLINRCEVTVPRRGQQQERKHLKDEFRKQNPEGAADLESQPWYVDPDGPYGGDDMLTIPYEWIDMGVPNCSRHCRYSLMPISVTNLLQQFACGPVSGIRKRNSSRSSTAIRSPHHLSHDAQGVGVLPADALLVNETDLPVCCVDDQEAA
jgi:hypothetical protein